MELDKLEKAYLEFIDSDFLGSYTEVEFYEFLDYGVREENEGLLPHLQKHNLYLQITWLNNYLND